MNTLLLFDIDGTLITGHGVPKKVAMEVIKRRFPDFKNGNSVAFNGMTDPLIIKEVLAANNHHISIDDPIIPEILNDFVNELRIHVNPGSPPSLLPGVEYLLKICLESDDIFVGLVTGNIMKGAKIKLSAVDIYKYFAIGAFGSDNWNRNVLPPIAIKRAEKYFGKFFNQNNIWIIGDSPRDVECAKCNGLKCIAVETGKVSDKVLAEAGADHVLKDLNDQKLLRDILEIRS